MGIAVNDWTGSGHLRREQLPGSPPAFPPNRTPRYFIPAGTGLSIRRIEHADWSSYTTKKPLGFDRYEFRDRGSQSAFVFRHEGFQILVSRRKVTQNF